MGEASSGRKALISGMWYTISNFFVKGLGVLTLPIFTRLLTEAQFGDYNNYISWQSIGLIIVTLNIESTLISAKFDYENFERYIFSVLVLSSISATVFIIVFNVFSDAVTQFLGMDMFTVNCMLAYIFIHPAVTLFQVRERYNFNYKKTVVISLVLSIFTVIMSLLFVLTFSDRLSGRILGNVLPTVLIGLILYIFFIIRGKKVDFGAWKYALPICLPFIPHLLSLTVLNSTDRIMITRLCDSRATALYSLAYSCGSIVTLLMTSINGAFAPWLGTKLNGEDYKSIRKVTPVYILSFCGLAIGLMLLAPEVLLILGGNSYLEAKYVMTPVAMGCVCQFLYTLYVNVEQFKKKTKLMAVASLSAAVLNLILNYVFIPKFGYIAAAYTTLVSYLWLLLIHMLIVRKMGMSFVYDSKLIFSVILFMGLVTVGITLLYKITWLRYVLIAVYMLALIILVYKFKDKLMGLIRKKKH